MEKELEKKLLKNAAKTGDEREQELLRNTLVGEGSDTTLVDKLMTENARLSRGEKKDFAQRWQRLETALKARAYKASRTADAGKGKADARA